MGSLTSKSCRRKKMVGEIYANDETVVAQKKDEEESGEETQKKESKKSLSDELLEMTEELEGMTAYVDRICAAASGPSGGLVSGMIYACVQSILRDEIKELTSEMTRYRTLLGAKMRETPEETLDLEATLKIDKLIDALGAGWKLLKQGESEEAVFETFMNTLDIRLPVPESPKEEYEKSSEDDVNVLSLMLQCCVQSILQTDIRELALEMVEFRNILSKKMLATPREELDLQGTFNLVKLTDGFEAGWRSFKHGCGEDAAFESFMIKMDVRKKDTTQH